jgi:hypothetical protein
MEKVDKVLCERVLLPLEASDPSLAYETLMREAVVRLDGALSSDLCDSVLETINRDLEEQVSSKNSTSPQTYLNNLFILHKILSGNPMFEETGIALYLHRLQFIYTYKSSNCNRNSSTSHPRFW